MRLRLVWLAVVLSIVPAAFAKDVYLSIGGSVGVFRTDARIFNPSQTKDIQIQAYYLPVGNVDNSAVQPTTITVPKRSQVVYDDVVTSLFHSSGLGAIRLTSADDFVATQRIYAGVTNNASSTPCSNSVNPCTLGQFLSGVEVSNAKKNGVLIQIKSNANFRTNVGLVNPNGTAANVSWKLYDKNNALISGALTGLPSPVAPFGVIAPSNIATQGVDLSDAWIGYTSDQPIVAYASVVDNGSTDQTYIPAENDSDPPTASTPTAKVINVTLSSFQIAFSPQPTGLRVGDQVTFKVSANVAGLHGFRLTVPDGSADLVQDRGPYPAGQTFTYNVTIPMEGTYFYTCTNPTCGTPGHESMAGTFDVGQGTDTGGPRY